MTLPDEPAPDRDTPQRPQQRRGWLVALVALPILCCAAPGLLAAVGIGSLGALIAAAGGRVTLAAVLTILAGGVVALLAFWRRGSVSAGEPSTQASQRSSEGR